MTEDRQDHTEDVVLRLRDEFAADRDRVRQTFLWFITFLIFVILAAVVIVLGAGIAMLRHTAAVLGTIEALDEQVAANVLYIGDFSNRVSQVNRGQLDLLSRLNALQISQSQTAESLRMDVERHGRWIASREQQMDRERMALDERLHRRGEVLDRLSASVDRVDARLQSLVEVGGQVIHAGEGAPPKPAEVSTGEEALTAGSRLLDSFEGVSLEERFGQIVAEALPVEPDRNVSRTISVIVYPNGDRYEGEFESGFMHGWGIYKTRMGDRYEGPFRNDLKHGVGTMILASGERYSGRYVDGIRQGLGSLTRADGSRYAGMFRNDMINGRGIMQYADGSVYAGDFLNGKRHGHGIHRFLNGDRYEGEFRQDLRTGTGRYQFADGSHYRGSFVDGVRHGQGHYVFADGTEFIGSFRNGVMHGEGVRIVRGQRLRGYWHEGEHVRDLRD